MQPEKRKRKNNNHKLFTNKLEVFKTAENPLRLVKPLSSFFISSSLIVAGTLLSLSPFLILIKLLINGGNKNVTKHQRVLLVVI